jgi:hypothetical protein
MYRSDLSFWRCGFVRIVSMELLNELLSILDVLDGFPSIFFGWVSFPVYQIFDLSSIFLRIADLFDVIFRFSFYVYRWWGRRFLLIAIFCRLVWRKVRLVENRMDGRPGFGEFEFVCRLSYFLEYLEWAIAFIGKFPGGSMGFDVC